MKMHSSVPRATNWNAFLCFIHFYLPKINPHKLLVAYLTAVQDLLLCKSKSTEKKRVKSYPGVLRTCCLGPCSCLEKCVLPEGHKAQICFLMEVSRLWNCFPQINFPLFSSFYSSHEVWEWLFVWNTFFVVDVKQRNAFANKTIIWK